MPQGITVLKKRWIVRYLPRFAAHREMPNIVTRPVIVTKANTTTANRLSVVGSKH